MSRHSVVLGMITVVGLLWLVLVFPMAASSFASPDLMGQNLRVRILSHYHPQRIEVRELATNAPVNAVDVNSSDRTFRFTNGFQLVLPEAGVQRSYAGDLEVHVRDGELRLINLVGMEAYVTSVVLSEMGWQRAEAMRAQAILARTWAHIHRRQGEPYDFGDRTDGQVYKGLFPQTKRLERLQKVTAGQLLWYRGQAAHVYYHAKCANRVFSAHEIWGVKKKPYLSGFDLPKGIRDGAETWQCSFLSSDIDIVFAEELSTPIRLEVEKRSGTLGVRLIGTNFDELWMSVDIFRLQVNRRWGWNKLKSNNFTISRDGDRTLFSGSGFGHLVGMCQQGAVKMAENGRQYQEILQFFYPGTIIHYDN